jgi:ABC-type multidrug transport system fused ATPase/permease subunit
MTAIFHVFIWLAFAVFISAFHFSPIPHLRKCTVGLIPDQTYLFRTATPLYFAKKKFSLVSNQLLQSLEVEAGKETQAQGQVENVGPKENEPTSNKRINGKTKNKEPKERKEFPSSRVRFAEGSSQPDFVSIGLEKVELVYGDSKVLKDASWSVCSGERVGLVGPNGCGKV